MQNSLSVLWLGLCLLLGLSVSWLVVIGIGFVFWQLGVRFGSGFVSGFVSGGLCLYCIGLCIGFVCLWVGKYVIMPLEGVSVGLFK